MAAPDLADIELKDLVAQTLENNGILGKIRAELRANVFMALEEQDASKNKMSVTNNELKQFLSTKEGSLIFYLVRDFLEFFNLEYTLAVLDSESATKKLIDRRELFEEFGLKIADGFPVLTEVLRSGRNNSGTNQLSSDIESNKDSQIKDNKLDSGLQVTNNLGKAPDDRVQEPASSADKLDEDSDAFFDEPLPQDKNSALYSFSEHTKQLNNGNEDANGNNDKLGLGKHDVKSDEDKNMNTTANLTELKNLPSLPGVEKKVPKVQPHILDAGWDIQ